MEKPTFDVGIIVPLKEEFRYVTDVAPQLESISHHGTYFYRLDFGSVSTLCCLVDQMGPIPLCSTSPPNCKGSMPRQSCWNEAPTQTRKRRWTKPEWGASRSLIITSLWWLTIAYPASQPPSSARISSLRDIPFSWISELRLVLLTS